MYRTAELLTKLKAFYGVTSDYALAKKMGVTRACVSSWSRGVTFFDDKVSFEVAEVLGLNPAILVASMHVERAERKHDESALNFWRQYAA